MDAIVQCFTGNMLKITGANVGFSGTDKRTQHHGKAQQTNERPTGGAPANCLGIGAHSGLTSFIIATKPRRHILNNIGVNR